MMRKIFIILLFLLQPPGTLLSQERIPFVLPSMEEVSRIQTAVITTNRGTLIFELFPKKAPWHVANFKHLADQDFYDGIAFHLFHRGYIIQGGSPSPKHADAGPGYELPPEFSQKKHIRGTLGMARRPDIINRSRKSHGSQFHILLKEAPRMDGSFTIFGQIVKGMSVLDSLRKDDVIQDIVVYVKPKNQQVK